MKKSLKTLAKTILPIFLVIISAFCLWGGLGGFGASAGNVYAQDLEGGTSQESTIVDPQEEYTSWEAYVLNGGMDDKGNVLLGAMRGTDYQYNSDSDELLIKTAKGLAFVAALANGKITGKEIKTESSSHAWSEVSIVSLGKDIDLSGKIWTPINITGSFTKVFNGNGFKITGCTIDSTITGTYKTGLFGNLSGDGVVKDLIFEGNCKLVADNATGGTIIWCAAGTDTSKRAMLGGGSSTNKLDSQNGHNAYGVGRATVSLEVDGEPAKWFGQDEGISYNAGQNNVGLGVAVGDADWRLERYTDRTITKVVVKSFSYPSSMASTEYQIDKCDTEIIYDINTVDASGNKVLTQNMCYDEINVVLNEGQTSRFTTISDVPSSIDGSRAKTFTIN